ncbi:hypothetical protein OED01_15535 [Microbacterium sp. M28]|uniref:hypothetical protein n=1 Tax=Microbacterium sp. M28 TaxID=2962064 RepID=UPI0021F438F8|nr:hypothetical protein [Microbacterium sp. M28]UYO96993.1 hypothetical protein OED01_15535 [Microbacterium sp. M28]
MTDEELATVLETAVTGVPGVVGVLRSGSLLGNALGAATEAVGLRDGGARLRASSGAERTRVEAAIAVGDSKAASATIAAARDAIVRTVAEHSLPPADVVLTVVRVEPV